MLEVVKLSDQCTGPSRHHLKLTVLLGLFSLFLLDIAESACSTGYYASGSSCRRCPTNCGRCTSSTRCSQCDTGHYGSHCQHSCRNHCTRCTADKNCQGCKTGYYGSYCHHSCSSGCLLQICRKSDGYCSEGCKDGYYMSNSKCKNCPSHCSRCSTSSICSDCKSGYWGTSCQYSCAHCTGSCSKTKGCSTGCTTGYYLSGGECHKCPSNCDRCSSPTHCAHCRSGYWGNTCQHTCMSCSGMCSKDTGCSGCLPGYYRHFIASKGGSDCLQCPTDCTACTDNTHCSACAINTFGSRCQYSCDGCKDTCDKTFGCTGTCSTGYYKYKVIEGSACEKCPSGCKTCSSSSGCYDCVDGKWGSQCPTDCDINCKLSACDKVTGVCTNGCNTGYKQIGHTCIACPTVCADCQIPNICSVCRERYYLSDNTCNQCPAGCENCTSSTLCTECITGRYGLPTCSNECSIGCKDSVCDQISGECTNGCLNTYYSGRCECTSSECTASSSVGVCSECSSGRWYPKDKGCCPCSQECKDNICYTNGTCKDCMTGRYGNFCENDCSSQCRNRECDRDGLCFSCIDGFYGDKCEMTCHSAITGCEICHVQNGSKITCTECIAGKYPGQTDCTDCNKNCKVETFPKCNSATGECKYGCKDNWSGPLCEIPCFVSRCELCDSADKNVCLSCLDGFYGDGPAACEECSKTCKLGTTCDRNNGLCTEGCVSGWSGGKCDERCSNSNCLDCDQDKGNTCVSCVLGKFGETCDKTCNRNCKSHTDKQTCEKISGRCLFGCEEGYWGNACSETCRNCGNFLCKRETGECLSSCKTNYYGDSCEGKCSEHCNQNVMLVLEVSCDNTGKCYDGCEDHWWGDRCDTKCSDHCNQTDCSEEDGKCKFGCTGGYTGDQCIVGPSLAASGEDTSNKGLTIGLPVALVLLTIAVAAGFAIFILFKKRRNEKSGVRSLSWKRSRKSSSSSSSSSSSQSAGKDEYEGLSDNKDVGATYDGLVLEAIDPVISDTTEYQDNKTNNEYTTIDETNGPHIEIAEIDTTENDNIGHDENATAKDNDFDNDNYDNHKTPGSGDENLKGIETEGLNEYDNQIDMFTDYDNQNNLNADNILGDPEVNTG